MSAEATVTRALISVSDKRGLAAFVEELLSRRVSFRGGGVGDGLAQL